MKIEAITRLRRMLAANEPVYGMWAAMETGLTTEIAVACGLDFVVVDAEHSSLDWSQIAQHVRSALRSPTVVFVRLVTTDPGLFRRALDIGADGIATPFCQSAEDVRRNVAFANYPPRGVRAVGADRANCWGHAMSQVAAEANDHVLLMPNLETVEAWRNIDSIVEVEGCDLFFVGPADFSASMGRAGEWMPAEVEGKLLDMCGKVRSRGKHIGIIANSLEDVRKRIEQGFRVICIGYDTYFLSQGIRKRLEELGRQVTFRP
jgi:2-keto-3-deoxy-L-rhamnonate aldolase RhmA